MLAGILQHYPRDKTSPPDRVAEDDHSLSYSESTMEENEEEEEVDEGYYSSHSSTIEPSMLWACILRNGTLLVKATADDKGPEVVGLARSLLRRKVTTDWDSVSPTINGPQMMMMTTLRGGGYKGLKFHVLEEEQDNKILVWTFACVYDSRLLRKEMAQAFVEQKLVAMTEGFREMDTTWRFGGHLACQKVFGPILRQRLDEMSYRSDVAFVDDGLEMSQETINNNIAILKRRQERIRKIKKKMEKMDKVQELDWPAAVTKQSGPTKTFFFSGWKGKMTHSRNISVDTTVDIAEESSEEGDAHQEQKPMLTQAKLKTTEEFDGGERGVVDIASIVEDDMIQKYTDDSSTRGDEDVEDILRVLENISTTKDKSRNLKKDKQHVRVGWKDQVPDKVVPEVQTRLVSDEVSILTETRETGDERPCFLCNICFWRKKPSNLVE